MQLFPKDVSHLLPEGKDERVEKAEEKESTALSVVYM